MYKMFICEYQFLLEISEMYFAIVASNNNLPLVKQKKEGKLSKTKKV